ncbi:MAG: type III-B CRISPR module RAMP protein Cmr4 [Verrucomicrobia bacterium]|nr:type III-B CRISPR module RAMP protein Cmr4 [Verrucomicrobiota bacterium]
MKQHPIFIFARTPLHIGAGSSVGAIDLPVQRERHTGFPIIPASSLKGSFADQWPTPLRNEKDEIVRVVEKNKAQDPTVSEEITILTKKVEQDSKKENIEYLAHQSAWLFGSDNTDLAFAGSLIFSEARVLAFPIRSARGSYAWITCPLMLQRAARDGVFTGTALAEINKLKEPPDTATQGFAIFKPDPLGLGAEKKQIVLEEYCFDHFQGASDEIAKALAALVSDTLFATITGRLVILSNGMMSHFVTTCCEVAQHVRISDETGTAEEGGLFNQENVPADTLFYSVLSATNSRVPGENFKDDPKTKPGTKALATFKAKVDTVKVFQFGGDATTGLGFCTVAAV